jgi:hypothetical protein
MHRLHDKAGTWDMQGMLKMASRPDAAKRWRTATTLIIDEVTPRPLVLLLLSTEAASASAETGTCIKDSVL